MRITKVECVQSAVPPANPYSGGERHPEIERIIEEGKQRRQETQSSPTGEQDDGGDDGEDDDIRSGGDYGVPAGYVCGNRPPPLLKSTNPGGARPVPLSSILPPPPNGAAVATASGDDDDMPPTGVYDGLAKLDPNTIVDKTYLAKMFGVSEKTIRRRVHSGELPPPCTRMRRQPQWLVGVLLDWLKDRARHIAVQEDARRQHIRERTETEPNN